ncbi:hypothetical protein [Mycoplasmopsis bovirhinis]|uniref:Uncharacterized protein n=1 Tax=Mycoplasmopsis bovirhinis TaxID=29553 RepID=A0A449AF19_9BACT|nr:hypothetical protein [Mycoplasmopsis bovirhinis]VEU63545.1 Uncharacterised protein [Mycoplasmopsis bovirhinis]
MKKTIFKFFSSIFAFISILSINTFSTTPKTKNLHWYNYLNDHKFEVRE